MKTPQIEPLKGMTPLGIKPQTDNAKPRPWYFKPNYDNNIDTDCQKEGVAGTVRSDDGWNIARVWRTDNRLDGNANASLIVRAVNEYAALCAVAEAAKRLARGKCSTELNSALIDLAAFRDNEHRKQYQVDNFKPHAALSALRK